MSLRFPYRLVYGNLPVAPLGGRFSRPRPLLPVTLIGPTDSFAQESLLDTGADDTLFNDHVAVRIGLDLSAAPTGTGAGIGLAQVAVRYAEVMLRITNGHEQREWKGWVGFTAAKLQYPILGFAGCLQYFDALFHGALEVVELSVNPLYPGT